MPTAAKPKPTSKPTSGKPDPAYERHKVRMAERSRVLSAANRDIGTIPKIKNARRRWACRLDFQRFCQTYNPEAFYLAWGPDQVDSAKMIEETVLHGALFANAEPRGSGKTTRARMAALWAVSYAHWRYAFVIGANASKAEDTLDAIKTFVRYLPLYVQDFPEIAHAVKRLGGIAQRANGQICGGEPTKIEWSQGRIILPTVPPPANWPKDWPLRSDGMAPTSGSIIGVAGLTGEGIRGSVITTTTGEQLRPDGVLLDDPQTDESAASPSQNESREQLIAGAVLGMAGPDKTIAAIMACTVIRPGDMADRMLNRDLHPLWRGKRMQLLRSMPSDLRAWEPYFALYRECAQLSPPDYSEANAYYVRHRAELDAGAMASWQERKKATEVSAIQYAMNLYARDKRAFFAEYQNEPLGDEAVRVEVVTADWICRKLNGVDRGIVPQLATRLTAGIDVQQTLLYYAVVAWEDNFTGYVIDYGAWPDQGRPYFTLADARQTLLTATGATSLEGSILQGLTRLGEQILGRNWEREDGAAMRVARCLIDTNWKPSAEPIHQYCRNGAFASVVMPSYGMPTTSTRDPYTSYKRKQGERVGTNWRMPSVRGTRLARHVLMDPNHWKSFLYSRLAVQIGDPGCLSLYGIDAGRHRMLADHITAERRNLIENKTTQRLVEVWEQKGGRPDNHLLDCVYAACVAAEIEGVALAEMKAPERPSGRRAAPSAEEAARRRMEFQQAMGY